MPYTPPFAQNMQDKKIGQIRLGIQGESGSFKTGAALTFPNPTVYDYDNGLRAYAGQDITVIPFHDYDFMCALNNGKYKPRRPKTQPNRRDALLWVLETEGYKMTEDQTLILDSWTTIQDAFGAEEDVEPATTKKGEIDEFAYWQHKIEYSEKIMSWLAALKCHVVVSFHEIKLRSPITGQLMDKIGPLMQGKFVAKLQLYFTDFFRAIAVGKTRKRADGTMETIGTEFFWQVRSDDTFTAKTRLLLPEGLMRVEPHYKIFQQYGKPL